MIKTIYVPSWNNYGARLEYVEYVPNIRKIMNIGNLGGRCKYYEYGEDIENLPDSQIWNRRHIYTYLYVPAPKEVP